MKFNHIVIDGSNLWWRSYTSVLSDFLKTKKSLDVKVKMSEKEICSLSLQNFFSKLDSLFETYGYKRNGTTIYIIFDNPHSVINLRKIISGGTYKHPRQYDNISKNVNKMIDMLEEILKCYSNKFKILRSKDLEADDLTLPLKEYIKPSKNNNILFISADLDWARNIEDCCQWFNFSTLYGIEKFKMDYGFDPSGNSIKLYKTIRGDNSDNIKPAIPGMHKPMLIELVTKFEDVYDLIKNVWSRTDWNHKWKKKIIENKLKLIKNYQLIDFISIEMPIEDYIIDCKENLNALRMWFEFFDIKFESRMLEDSDKKERAKQILKRKTNFSKKRKSNLIFE